MNNQQIILRSLLIVQTLALVIYTYYAIQHEGWDLFNIFLNDIFSLNWSGQFNLDFTCYLLLSGIWIMWRNEFTGSSILIAIVAMIIGIMVFAPYVLYLLSVEKGNLNRVLSGNR